MYKMFSMTKLSVNCCAQLRLNAEVLSGLRLPFNILHIVTTFITVITVAIITSLL